MTSRTSTSLDTILEEAPLRARTLVDDLSRLHADLSSNPGSIDRQKLDAGQHLLQHAIDSARRLLETLEPTDPQSARVVESTSVEGHPNMTTDRTD